MFAGVTFQLACAMKVERHRKCPLGFSRVTPAIMRAIVCSIRTREGTVRELERLNEEQYMMSSFVACKRVAEMELLKDA